METSMAVLERPAPGEPQEEAFTRIPTPYPEFHGPGGDRYLKKLLRQILPMALYRTWEIYVDYQARGNDCFLSLSQLALAAGRSLRTMQKNVACLHARQLVVERIERKSFAGPDGHCRSRMVMVKDFTTLYALAHEYHEWLHTEGMLPPERAFLPLLVQNPLLVAKLQRFDNYRRLLSHHPESAQQAQEVDQPGSVRSTPHAAVPAGSSHAPSHATFLDPKAPSKGVSKMTPKRINESSHRDDLSGDSFDSAFSFSDFSVKGKNDAPQGLHVQSRCKSREKTQKRAGSAPPDAPMTLALSPTPRQRLRHCPPSPRQTQGATRDTKQPGQEAITPAHQRLVPLQPHDQACEDPAAGAQLPDLPLARSFLHMVAVPFGDRNPQGTLTRILGLLASASLEEAEILPCLVRAYTIARDTRTIRECYVNQETGQANRMPLFCTLVERFIQARMHQDSWQYSWHQMEEALVADERLHAWWTRHQALLAGEQPLEAPHDPVPVPPEPQDEQESTPPLLVGWARREAALAWGERLIDALIASGYEADVRLRQVGQWYQLVLNGEDCSLAIETPAQAQVVLEQFQKGEV